MATLISSIDSEKDAKHQKVYPLEGNVLGAFPDPVQGKMTRDMANAVLLQVCDGYSNIRAYLGADSPLISSGTFVRSGLAERHELLTTAYRENWLTRRIIDMPSEDITRNWYKLNTSMPAEKVEQLRKLEAKHNIKQEITDAIRWARLYGGSIAYMVTRGGLKPDMPLIPAIVFKDDFQGLLVMDRSMVTPSIELETNINDPDYGLPKWYGFDVQKADGSTEHIEAHHSRILRFTGRELPPSEIVRENYWGAPEMEHIWDELMKRSSTSDNIAQLVFQANITTLKMGDLGADLALGSERTRANVIQAIENENRLRTSYGLQVISSDDSIDNHPYNFAGLAEIYEAFMMDMAGASGIPATKLFGRSPEGMNATGESDLRNYADMIAQEQERMLRPALEKLLPILALSCWNDDPEDMEIIFEPVMTMSPAERSKLSREMGEEIRSLLECGLITKEEARAELKERGRPLGSWGKIT